MRNPMVRIAVVAIILAAATLGLIVYSALQQTRVSCEVCITFGGRTQCRTALGASRDEAIRTATDNACAYLASGMADSIRCTNTPPTSVSCEE